MRTRAREEEYTDEDERGLTAGTEIESKKVEDEETERRAKGTASDQRDCV